MHRVESASLSMEANDLEQVLGTLRQQALELEARYSDQVGLRRIHLSLCQTPPPGPHLRSDHVQTLVRGPAALLYHSKPVLSPAGAPAERWPRNRDRSSTWCRRAHVHASYGFSDGNMGHIPLVGGRGAGAMGGGPPQPAALRRGADGDAGHHARRGHAPAGGH